MSTRREIDSHGCTCPERDEEPSAEHGQASHADDGRLFKLGTVVATPRALLALVRANQDVAEILARHAHGDWGAVAGNDAAANDRAAKEGTRILSVYPLPGGAVVRIVTEADRSATCVLLPEED